MNFSECFALPLYTDHYAYDNDQGPRKLLFNKKLALPSFIAQASCKATGSIPAEL